VRNYGTSSLQLMLYSNFWGMIFVAIGIYTHISISNLRETSNSLLNSYHMTY